MPDLSIIIVNWNTRAMLLDCIGSVYRNAPGGLFELIVVDNGSTDGSVEAVSRAYPGVILIANTVNEGFARANNRALGRMLGRYAVLLNSDTIIREGALERLRSFMDAHPDAGMCGPQLLNADNTRQKSHGRFPSVPGEFMSRSLMRVAAPRTYRRLVEEQRGNGSEPFRVDFIIGACMVARKEAIAQAGMLDEAYFFFYEEIDWCWRMKNSGWRVYHVPDAEIYHLGGGSTREVSLRARAESWRSRYLYFQKSLSLGPLARGMLTLAGSIQVAYHLAGYTLLNLATFFGIGRLRRRWSIFAYLLLWHLRGLPVSMCLPRRTDLRKR